MYLWNQIPLCTILSCSSNSNKLCACVADCGLPALQFFCGLVGSGSSNLWDAGRTGQYVGIEFFRSRFQSVSFPPLDINEYSLPRVSIKSRLNWILTSKVKANESKTLKASAKTKNPQQFQPEMQSLGIELVIAVERKRFQQRTIPMSSLLLA